VDEYVKPLLEGVPLTLLVTAGAFTLGALAGLPLLLLRRSRFLAIRLPTMFVIDLVRAIPGIAWLFLIYYGLAQQGVQLEALPAAILALGIYSAAHMAEIYRSGLLSVDRGQWEAARAVGLTEFRAFTDVIVPQAIRVVIPPSTGYLINLLKDSAVASVIGLTEITYHAHQQAQETFNGLTVFIVAALLYIILSVPLAGLSRMADARLRAAVAR
jgi:His/Glu/Gln/Arg/opine family amino acid ABC transporter permease subunit